MLFFLKCIVIISDDSTVTSHLVRECGRIAMAFNRKREEDENEPEGF